MAVFHEKSEGQSAEAGGQGDKSPQDLFFPGASEFSRWPRTEVQNLPIILEVAEYF